MMSFPHGKAAAWPAIAGVILDVDGTLVDSNDAHARAWVEALAEFGFDVPTPTVRQLIGMGSDNLLPRLTRLDSEVGVGAAIVARRAVIFRERHLPFVRPFPGAATLLKTLRGRGVRLVVASSAREDELRPLLRLLDAEWLLDDAVSSEQADRSKPDPDLVAIALAKVGLPHERVVMLGDTPYDVLAARQAGIACIAVRCGGWSDADLAGAAAIFDDPMDLLARLDASELAAH
jgi:phosphoglycolate phosphatase-like HAD superfamily hydrolase